MSALKRPRVLLLILAACLTIGLVVTFYYWVMLAAWFAWLGIRIFRAMSARKLGPAEIHVGFAATYGTILGAGVSGGAEPAFFTTVILCVPAFITLTNMIKWHFNREEITAGRHMRVTVS